LACTGSTTPHCTVMMHAGSTTPTRAPLCPRDGEHSGRADTSPKSAHSKTGTGGKSTRASAPRRCARNAEGIFSRHTGKACVAEGPLGKYTGKARKRQGLPGQHGTRPARCLEARAVNDGEPQSGSGYPKGVRSQWRTRPRLPRACTPEPIRLQRHAPNTPATAAEAADRGAAMFTAAPIRRTIAARPNPAQLQAEHDHTTQASSCPAIAAGSNPAPVRARPQPRNPRRTPAPSPPPARTPAHANPARAVQRVQC
jgi:hypothetical protein